MAEALDAIILDKIRKCYTFGETNVYAVTDVSFSLKRGAFVAICGPSGSGKSTLLNICGLLDTYDKGSYCLNGKIVDELSDMARTNIRRKEIGFIFQGYNLIPVMTVFDNVAYPLFLLGYAKNKVQSLTTSILRKVGLEELANRVPDQLSGGQRQRVAIARALIKSPALIIADEPTANLDTKTAEVIVDLMKELGHQFSTTFLIATHDERMTKHCDKVFTLTDGVLI